MTRSTVRIIFIAVAVLLGAGLQRVATAQEAVSTTESSTSSESTGTSSTSISGSTEPGSDLSTTTTSAPAVTTSGTATAAAPTLERNPSGAGVYAPTPVKIYFTVSGGYDDNVATTSLNKQSSAFTSGDVILDYTFGDPRLQLTINAGGGGTYYFSHISTQDYDIDLKGALAATYKVSPRLTLGGSVLVAYLTEPSFQYTGGINSRNGNYLYTTDRAFVEYAWSRRFSTRTAYTFEAYNYDNDAVGQFSNRVSNVFGNEFRLQMVPTTNLVAEYRFGIISYQDSFLDSQTHYALAGIDHIFNPRLTATFRGGAQFRSYNNDADRTGPYFEGNVTYALGHRTAVTWITRYGLEEPDNPISQSRTTFRTGLQTKFDVTSRVETALDLFYVHDDYHALTNGPAIGAFSEDTFDIGVTGKYAINSMFAVQLGYHFTDVSSDTNGRDYSRNRVSGGVNVTF
ncbi:MAG TPA: outer membrane beta-barrel protein [Chthoniobacterales bacterium]|nr:outer membrane beta-barrel protein [Chthoniobacterales bacterium]